MSIHFLNEKETVLEKTLDDVKRYYIEILKGKLAGKSLCSVKSPISEIPVAKSSSKVEAEEIIELD